MSYVDEFKTVDLILDSCSNTRTVDAFALSLIKAERQTRKLFTYLVYQFPAFGPADRIELRRILAASTSVYFDGLIKGLDQLSPLSMSDLVGTEYANLSDRFRVFGRHRNKIFHGQITGYGLSAARLSQNIVDIRLWCQTLAGNALPELGYDGFGRNSFRKSDTMPNLSERLNSRINSLAEYEVFIRNHMERPRQRRCTDVAPTGALAASEN